MQQTFCRRVTELVEEVVALWDGTKTDSPPIGRAFSVHEQRQREMVADRCIQAIESELRKIPRTASEREKTQARIAVAFGQFASAAVDVEDPGVEILLRDGFFAVGIDLARWARGFDPQVSMNDILQACRNTWTACGLQALLGKTMRLTPSIFAYSMLYPYSDNYMDDPGISSEAKLGFSERFRCRLGGESIAPVGAREAAIWRLVDCIESQYDRTEYRQVYDSLLAIHHAQEQSLWQLQQPGQASAADVLRLSCTKGGTSVLADAYLAAGSLSESEARFAFQWGVLLQLGDDLQDLQEDIRRGSLTLFSQAAAHGPLNALTNQLFHFAAKVMRDMDALENSTPTLNALLKESSRSLLVRAAADAPDFYTEPYLCELECYSPFGFRFLKKRQKQVVRRERLYGKLFEALVQQEDGPVLPVMATQLAAD